MGGYLMALLGRHLKHQEEARQLDRHLSLAPLFSVSGEPGSGGPGDPLTSPYSTAQIMGALEDARANKYLPPEHIAKFKQHVKTMTDARDAQVAAQRPQPPPQAQPLGMPSMDPGADAAKPAPMPQATPAAGNFTPPPQPDAAPQGQFPPLPGSGGAPLPVQLAMAAMLSGQGNAPPPPGLTPTGSPPAAPIPPPLAAASASGGQGFSGTTVPGPVAQPAPMTPPPAPVGLPPMPGAPVADPALAAQIAHNRFQMPAMNLADIAARKGQAAAAAALPLAQQHEAMGQARVDALRKSESYRGLTDRQKMTAESAAYFGHPLALTPEPHFSIPNIVLSQEGDIDENGKPVEPGTPGKKSFINGQEVFFPTSENLAMRTVTGPDGKKRTVFVNRRTQETSQGGDELTSSPNLRMIKVNNADGTVSVAGVNPVSGKMESEDPKLNGLNPAMFATQATNFRAEPQPDGTIAFIPVTTSIQKIAPGMPPPPGMTQPPSGVAAPARPRGPATGVGAPITAGETASARRMRLENPYTPNGAKVMTELEPRMQMVGRLLKQLEPYKNKDIPMTSALDSLAYKMGYAGDTGGFLSQLNLGSIAQAGSLIKGVSRSQQVLGQAMVHTPDAWKDSGKMMYQKLSEIYRNMQDMKSAVDKYEKKYPGMGQGELPKPNVMPSPDHRQPLDAIIPAR